MPNNGLIVPLIKLSGSNLLSGTLSTDSQVLSQGLQQTKAQKRLDCAVNPLAWEQSAVRNTAIDSHMPSAGWLLMDSVPDSRLLPSNLIEGTIKLLSGR